MDKHNYTPNEEKSQVIYNEIIKIRQEIVNRIESSGVIRRRRKVKSAETLTDAILLMIIHNLSLRRLAEIMAVRYNIFMSDTAWEKQLVKCSEAFEQATLSLSSLDGFPNDIDVHNTYLVDASNIPKEGGKGDSVRLHCSYCLDSRRIDETHLSDWHKAESLRNFNIHRNALYIADRAYGKADQMEYVLSHGADFILRISPKHIRLYSDEDCHETLSFPDILRDTPEEKLVLRCYVKYRKCRFPVVIQATRIPDDKLANVERRQRKTAQKKQYKISEDTRLLSKWVILASSLDHVSNDLLALYSSRWQIELLFKRSKSIFHFHRLRRSSATYAFSVSRIWSALIRVASFAASKFQIPDFDFFSVLAACFS